MIFDVIIVVSIINNFFEIFDEIFNKNANIKFSHVMFNFVVQYIVNDNKHDQIEHRERYCIFHQIVNIFIKLSLFLNVFDYVTFDLKFIIKIRKMFLVSNDKNIAKNFDIVKQFLLFRRILRNELYLNKFSKTKIHMINDFDFIEYITFNCLYKHLNVNIYNFFIVHNVFVQFVIFRIM